MVTDRSTSVAGAASAAFLASQAGGVGIEPEAGTTFVIYKVQTGRGGWTCLGSRKHGVIRLVVGVGLFPTALRRVLPFYGFFQV